MSDESAENAGYRYVDSEGEWYPEDDTYYCEECGKYYLEEDYDVDLHCCNNCAKDLEGEEEENE